MKRSSDIVLIFAVTLLTITVHWRIDNKITSDIVNGIASNFDSKAPTLNLVFDNQTARSNNYSSSFEREIVPHPNSSSKDEDGGSSVICLIIKDDNDILAEWVAYHYHVFNLRQLIVAVDPTSKTSPVDVLEPFAKSNGNFDLEYTLWYDEDFTPTWFQSNDPASYVNAWWSAKNNKINCGPLHKPDPEWTNNKTQTEDEIYMNLACKYMKRQQLFYSKCIDKINKETMNASSWTALIDTDEYLVPNPWIAQYIYQDKSTSLTEESLTSVSTHFQRDELKSMYPVTPSAGSLWSLFHRFATKSNTCVMIPRITFGGEEDSNDSTSATSATPASSTSTTVWSHKNFESLRWKYHRDHIKRESPKAILDAATVDNLDLTSPRKRTLSIHIPHKTCDPQVSRVNNPNLHEQPFALHHYIGSLGRFLNRDDVRRTVDSYNDKTRASGYAIGDENNKEKRTGGERWWIKGWLNNFVETHGSKKAYTVLGKDYATIIG